MTPSLPLLRGMAARLLDLEVVTDGGGGSASGDDPARVAGFLMFGRDALEYAVARAVTEQLVRLHRDPLEGLTPLAGALVDIQGGVPRRRLDGPWTVLTLLVDPDPLACAVMAPRLDGKRADRPLEVHPSVVGWPCGLARAATAWDGLLREPFAETHAHLGGCAPTSVLWRSLLTSDLPGDLRFPQDARGAWDRLLRRARVAFLAIADPASRGTPLDADMDAPRRIAAHLGRLLAAEGLDVDAEADTRLLGSYTLAQLVPERRILTHAIREWERCRDEALADALRFYLRARNSFHYLFLHQPNGRGLGRFLTTFARRGTTSIAQTSAQVRRLERQRLAVALEGWFSDAANRGHPVGRDGWGDTRPNLDDGRPTRTRLRNPVAPPFEAPLDLELRVHLDLGEPLRTGLVGWLEAIRETMEAWGDPPVRIGFVHHFLKRRGDAAAVTLREAEHLHERLRQHPDLRLLIVGIDAAGGEIDTSPRDHAAAYRALRRLCDRPDPDDGPPIRLGATYHAGEDFRDLLTGIRSVYDATVHLGLRPNDRLGHALALAWSPRRFYRERGLSWPTLREHALDLLFAVALLQRAPPALRRHGTEARDRLRDLLQRENANDAFHGALRLLDVRGAQETAASEAALLDALGLGGSNTDVLVDVDGDDPSWVELVTAVQRLTAQRVRESGVVIETNPTSNLLIGGFRSYVGLPYLRLNRTGLPPGRDYDIPLSINTDDPGIFGTSLRTEFAALGDALHRQRYSRAAVSAWLDAARRTGLRTTFLPVDAPRGRALRHFVESVLRRLGG